MEARRTEVDIVDELATIIKRIAREPSIDATDGDVLMRARLSIVSLRSRLEMALAHQPGHGPRPKEFTTIGGPF